MGSPLDGLHYLADSNNDWGQNLRDLKKVTDSLGIRKLKLSYFGADNPWAYYSDRELEMMVPPWNDQLATGMEYRPEPGYYAISVNLLPGHMFDTK